jgi:hypothetical protein
MGLKIDVMEREWKIFNFWSASKQGPTYGMKAGSQAMLAMNKVLYVERHHI